MVNEILMIDSLIPIIYYANTKENLSKIYPAPCPIFVTNEPLIMASWDRRLAIAMAFASRYGLEIGFIENTYRETREFYIEELSPRAFDALNTPVTLYHLDPKRFKNYEAIEPEELVSYLPAKVIRKEGIKDAYWELNSLHTRFIKYKGNN